MERWHSSAMTMSKCPAVYSSTRADHGLKQGHGDLLLLARHPGPQPVARIRPEDVLDGFQCLLCELVAVHEEEDSFGPAGLQKPLQVEADEIGLSGPGWQLDQEAPPAQLQRVVERLHRLGLVGPHHARLPLAM